MARRRRRNASLTLTQACQALLGELEADLWKALEEDPAPGEEARLGQLRAEWQSAKNEHRTAKGFDAWLAELVTQIGASWVLSCVFVRFVEDNELIDSPRLSGRVDADPTRSRLAHAQDREQAYYAEHLVYGERDWLKAVFRELARLPGLDELLDERHALLWRLTPRNEGGQLLVEFFREIDDETGELRFDFTDPALDTRFLGDLYQDLSESARATYALLQTPDFIERFLLDRTLEPALETFGLPGFRMIDPTCGSGHFLLGAFERLFARWQAAEPGTEPTELARRALDAVHGVDLNPFAAAIARFRLLVAALRASGTKRLADAPRFPIHVAVGDSLMHGERHNDPGRGRQLDLYEEDAFLRRYPLEATTGVREILNRQYHAVVGNPPYITPKDAALNALYRTRFGSCSGKYALSVPFMERFVELAQRARDGQPAGFVGKITSNSFMKREFGKKLVREFFPRWDLTHVIDTSGAYIPGHGTPTVILFLRDQAPAGERVRAVLGIRGEPSTPADPAQGLVWSAIVEQVDRPGSESDYVSVEEKSRDAFGSHPWALGGGGASDVMEAIEERADARLGEVADSIGITCFTLEDDAFVRPADCWQRLQPPVSSRPMVEGDSVRDWSYWEKDHVAFPYDQELLYQAESSRHPAALALWAFRSSLRNNKLFGSLRKEEGGIGAYEFGRFTTSKFATPLSIAFAFVATHNHFVLDRGGKVFKQSAPVIKLPPDATEDDHFALLAVLNSSTACFWAHQTLHNKGGGGIGGGLASEEWEKFLEWESTKFLAYPLPKQDEGGRANRLHQLGWAWASRSPENQVAAWSDTADIDSSRRAQDAAMQRMIAEQEELDWAIYHAYGLTDEPLVLEPLDDVPPLALGERAFEIVMARRMAAGELETTWFERHGSTPITEIPAHWPDAYRRLVERRIALIESDRNLGLLEQPEHKRRWNVEPWDRQVERALTTALLDRIEALPHWKDAHPAPRTVAQLAELLEGDERFLTLLRLRTGEDAPDVERAVAELVEAESVPFLPALYLEPAGLRKRAEWEETWRLQRLEDPFLEQQDELLRAHFGDTPADQKRAREHVACWLTSNALTKDRTLLGPCRDKEEAARRERELEQLRKLRDEWRAIDAERQRVVGGPTPPVPPKYASGDFQRATYWRLRGKLDVPKERFVSYPGCSPEGDPSLLVGWAGWDHAQRASALVQVLQARKAEGWTGERLAPLLQGLDQILPWLHQWHEPERARQYEQLVETEALAAGLTPDDLRTCQAPTTRARGGRRRSAP